MSWAAYYHRSLYDDTLLIVIEPAMRPTRIEKRGQIVALYADEKLIGMNFLHISDVIKMKAHGRIPYLPIPIWNILNDQLQNVGFSLLPEQKNSGFFVGNVQEVLNEREVKVAFLNQEYVFPYQGSLKKEDEVVIAMEDTILFSGVKTSVKHLCLEEDMGGIGLHTFIVAEQLDVTGKDYFVTPYKKG